jgi:ketosteroid isomerase-like protein
LVQPPGQAGPELRATTVFQKRDGKWKMIAGHLSPAPRSQD